MLTTLVLLWLTMLAARGTPVGREMHRLFVEFPARRLSGITRGHVLLAMLTLTIIVSVIWLLENDGRMLVSMGLPEFMSFAAAIDLSALLDLTLVAVVAATTIRVRGVVAWIAQRLTPRRPRARRPRVQRLRKPANDDEDRPALAA